MKPSTIDLNAPEMEVPAQFANDISRGNIWFMWTVMEDIQEHQPYFEFGWFGFVPLVIFRN